MNNPKLSIENYRQIVEDKLNDYLKSQTLRSYYFKDKYPNSLFDPLNYIMSGGGKRIRPLIMILTCEAFGGSINDAIDAAIAIEILHNFTLVHDDIMDNADTRRGKETIHKKWSVSTAILVGDELIGLSYRSLLKTDSKRIDEIVKAFTEGVIEVCEGQALDNQFENKSKVSLAEYMIMIRKKTAELLRISAIIGAIIANCNKDEIEIISEYASNLGLAFQIQDDLLDVIADETEFGKKIGGDIREQKKTYLFLKSLEIVNEEIREKLNELYLANTNNDNVKQIIDIYRENGVLTHAKNEIKKYTDIAVSNLFRIREKIPISSLKYFSEMLLNRGY